MERQRIHFFLFIILLSFGVFFAADYFEKDVLLSPREKSQDEINKNLAYASVLEFAETLERIGQIPTKETPLVTYYEENDGRTNLADEKEGIDFQELSLSSLNILEGTDSINSLQANPDGWSPYDLVLAKGSTDQITVSHNVDAPSFHYVLDGGKHGDDIKGSSLRDTIYGGPTIPGLTFNELESYSQQVFWPVYLAPNKIYSFNRNDIIRSNDDNDLVLGDSFDQEVLEAYAFQLTSTYGITFIYNLQEGTIEFDLEGVVFLGEPTLNQIIAPYSVYFNEAPISVKSLNADNSATFKISLYDSENVQSLIPGSTLIVGDYIIGGKGADIIKGINGNDYLSGLDGNDIIYGGRANDFLMGGAGEDTLYGGAGEDTFVFNSKHESTYDLPSQTGFDIVMDFTEGDKIEVGAYLDGYGGTNEANNDAANGLMSFFDSTQISGAEIYNSAQHQLSQWVRFVPNGANSKFLEVDADGLGTDLTYIRIAEIRGAISGLDLNDVVTISNYF